MASGYCVCGLRLPSLGWFFPCITYFLIYFRLFGPGLPMPFIKMNGISAAHRLLAALILISVRAGKFMFIGACRDLPVSLGVSMFARILGEQNHL